MQFPVEITNFNLCEMFSLTLVYLLFLVEIIVNASPINDEVMMKIAMWSADSGLELKEVCRNDRMNILILEGLQITSVNDGKLPCLKMLPLGMSPNFKPFPHIYRYEKEKDKGAVFPDFLEVSELGRALESCKRRKVKILVQVKIDKEVKLTHRQTILMSVLLWNSFFYTGDYYDRPFGKEIVFDGIHFIYEKGTSNISNNLMKRINEMAKFEEQKIILSSQSNDIKDIKAIPSESNFIITSPDSITTKTAPGNFSFVVLTSSDGSKMAEKFKNFKTFKGTATRLNKNSRIAGLKTLISRNPKNETSGIPIFAILLFLSSIVFISGIIFYNFKRKLLKKKDSSMEME